MLYLIGMYVWLQVSSINQDIKSFFLFFSLFVHRSTSDIGSKVRIPESSGVDPAQHHDQASFAPGSRAPMSVGPLDQSAFHSGEKIGPQTQLASLRTTQLVLHPNE